MKLRTKFILKGIFHSLLQFLIIFTFAWFNDCIIEMAIVYVCFFTFRPKFDKQYHAKTTWGCTILTIIIYYIVSNIIPSENISLLIVILSTFMINHTSYLYRDYLDLQDLKTYLVKPKKNTNRKVLIDLLGKDNLDEESIEVITNQLGLHPKYSETIYLYLNNTIEEVSEILDIDNSTITRRIKTFISELRTRNKI